MTPARRTPNSLARQGGLENVPNRRFVLGRSASQALARARLETFAAAFLGDARPGLVFEYGRLVFANEAAKTLFRSSANKNAFLAALKDSLVSRTPAPGLYLQADEATYIPSFQPPRARAGHVTRICFLARHPEGATAFDQLTARERSALSWLMKGATNAEIARGLGIAIETARKHVASILKKTGTHTRAALVAKALPH